MERAKSYGSYGRVIWPDLTRQSVREENVPEGELWISAQGPPGVFSHVLKPIYLDSWT